MISYNELVRMALVATRKSYSPYSHFKVGAALLLVGDEVVTGCNVENASYGLSMCAERIAVFKAVSQGKRKFKAISVVSKKVNPSYPCGACRQVLREFAPRIKVVVVDRSSRPIVTGLEKLLPDSFGPEYLRKRSFY